MADGGNVNSADLVRVHEPRQDGGAIYLFEVYPGEWKMEHMHLWRHGSLNWLFESENKGQHGSRYCSSV